MYSPIFIFGCLLLAIRVSAQDQCRTSIPFHQVVSAPEGVLTIDDEDGSRQIKATVFNTADCPIHPTIPTGSSYQVTPNLTALSQDGSDPDSCEAKPDGNVYTIDSFQAIVVETNGWPLNDLTFNISDIDGPFTLREGAAVFGLRNGGLVLPNMILPEGTRLRPINFSMPEASNNQLGISLGTVTIPGVFTNVTGNSFFCPPTGDEANECYTSVSFSVPVDTLVVIGTMEERGELTRRSLALLSPFSTACGCRCRENNPGTRQITMPVPGVPGECTMREASGPKNECDVLGSQWCQKEPKSEFALTGNTLPNGNLECTTTEGTKLSVQQEFTPNPNFAGNT